MQQFTANVPYNTDLIQKPFNIPCGQIWKYSNHGVEKQIESVEKGFYKNQKTFVFESLKAKNNFINIYFTKYIHKLIWLNIFTVTVNVPETFLFLSAIAHIYLFLNLLYCFISFEIYDNRKFHDIVESTYTLSSIF